MRHYWSIPERVKAYKKARQTLSNHIDSTWGNSAKTGALVLEIFLSSEVSQLWFRVSRNLRKGEVPREGERELTSQRWF